MLDTLKNNYKLYEELGRGRFGTVFRCTSPNHDQDLACKIINKNLLTDSTDRECLQNEPKIMTLLPPHPNILQIFDLYENDDFLAIVVELCEPVSLYDQILEKVFTEQEAVLVMKSLLEAILHCHQNGVVHRDVKPDNVMFDSRKRLKLVDFGSAEWIGESGATNGVVGTPYYVAPEVLSGRDYGDKVDVWSAGVVLYIMLSGVPPFYGESAQEVFEAVLRGNLRFPLRAFKGVSSQAKDFMRKLMCRDVSRRLSAEQALRHPWILSEGETCISE